MPDKVNLLDYNYQDLRDFFAQLDEKPFRAQQLLQWLHQKGVKDFSQMSNFSKRLQQNLAQRAEIRLPAVERFHCSKDGTAKWLLKLDCGNCIETVFIPEARRGTLCVSSQVGCALNCSFCSTAKQGFNRNLSVAEIIGQVWIAVRALSEQEGFHDKKVTNVVMMGMGEPLLNFDNVVSAMSLMMEDFAYGLSKRRVTLSTSGVVPEMERLQSLSPVSLAVSLHAPTDALRNELVPINKKYPLALLMETCKHYFKKDSKRKVTFEYVLLDGVNDELSHAKALVRLLKDVPSKINLIPFNPFPFTPYRCSPLAKIEAFRQELVSKGIVTTIRKTRGDDIDAACGQLAGDFNDKTSRSSRWQKIHFGEVPRKTSLPQSPGS